jgi:hypothetical protein
MVSAMAGWVGPAEAAGRVVHQGWTQTALGTTFLPQAGEIYVATSAGVEEARSFVQLDVAGLDQAAIAGTTLVLHEASDGFMPAAASIAVCALEQRLNGDGRLSTAPAGDCALRSEATRQADGSWIVALQVFASHWANGSNPGLVLFPGHSQSTATWRIALATAKSDLVVPMATPTVTVPITDTQAAGPQTAGGVVPITASPSQTAPPPALAVAGTGTALAPALASAASPTSHQAVVSPARRAPIGLPAASSTMRSAMFTLIVVLVIFTAMVIATPLRRRVMRPTFVGAGKVLDTVILYGPLALIGAPGRERAGDTRLRRRLMGENGTSNPMETPRLTSDRQAEPVSPTTIVAALAIVAGFTAIALAWWHITTIEQVARQNQEILSGGVGGLGLILLGIGLLTRERLGRNQALLVRQLERLVATHSRADDQAPVDGSAACESPSPEHFVDN